jgi:hypothetical protein
MSKLQVTYTVPNFPSAKARMIGRDQTVQEVISLIARMDNADVDQLSLGDTVLPPDQSFDDFYESKDQLFVFSKATSPKRTKQFPPSMKKGKLRCSDGTQSKTVHDIPDGIIAHLTRECGGNVHDRQIVDVTCGSFEKETEGANPHSGADINHPGNAGKNAADLETDSYFYSAHRDEEEDIPHTRNNWICYNFKERRIVPTHYAIRTNGWGNSHLKSWLVETSADGENWREVAREEDDRQLNGLDFTVTFPVADGGECRFIRLVNIGRNYSGQDNIVISAWEIFGSLIE